ncbi:MBL fold metallo-hydrolase [Priestia endophytica]|uniref:MBL fold metallo-hydrolase n=1 Tax=Priestia endophytica TaxID=135735 RepID=UPI00227E594A|nr:MBL fold metallo-hydrolase [Priestia endophytica]MCY8234480.1 MBL fold metallo-hydrolase [Priestia endophytica]
MIYLIAVLLVLCLAIVSFINFHPVFGGSVKKEQKDNYSSLNNYQNGRFMNLVPTNENMGVGDMFSMLKDSFRNREERKPNRNLPIVEVDWNKVNSEKDSLTWFGHSAFLLSIDGKKLLVDPMLGSVASPVSFVGSKRYSQDTLTIIERLPRIDAVLLTHDHYDHLDYPSIRKLKNKVEHFFVPLGVSPHLLRWGIVKEKITELNWWEEREFKGLTVALTPSKHFSGRGVFNRNTTLWGGWVVLGQKTRFYTSGDGGYDEHFKEIGKKYGPFDMTLMEGGQYDQRWSDIHMKPEESVQANIDVGGKRMMLIHWGAFTLAFHPWTEPVERALIEAQKEGVNMVVPKIGETIELTGEISHSSSVWWRM